jgi:hypothetical protein
LGYTNNKLDEDKLREILVWTPKNNYSTLPLFNSSYFNEYNKLRFKDLNYSFTGGKAKYDFKDFVANSRTVYDEFIKVTVVNETIQNNLLILLQDKLLDRMVTEAAEDKQQYFYDILSLRLDSKKSRSYEYVYEFFESKVRLQILEKMIDNNTFIIKQFMDKVNIGFESQDGGSVYDNEIIPEYISSDIMNEKLAANEESAKSIIQEINKYIMYKTLKDNGISNRITVSFETNKQAWIQNLKMLFTVFTDGNSHQQYTDQSYQMCDFVIFIKEFVDYSRTLDSSDVEGRKTILKLRQSVLQFMPIQEASFWLLDKLYTINFDI